MNHDTLTGWGMTLLKMDFYEEAREKLDLAVKLNKNNKMAVMLLAIAYKYLGDYGKANTYLASLVKTAPDGINTHEYAELRYLCDDYEDAEYYAKKSIEFYADILGPYVLLGKIYTHKCERETAMSYFQTALDRNLVNEELYIAWVDAFIRFGEYDEAYKKVLEGLKTGPEDLVLHDRLALCNALKGAKTMQPGVSDLIRGITAYNNKDFQTTIEVVDINAAEEKDAIKCYYLAKAYGWVNDFERACGYYEEALEKNPVFADARLDYVKYLISKEKYTDARYKLRKAPKTPEFEELAAFVESKL
jgi:tetratricopeptide (TPR) repeat protein